MTEAPPKIARIKQQDGLYLVSSDSSNIVLPLMVRRGKLYSVNIDQELADDGWPFMWREPAMQERIQVRGPLSLTSPADTGDTHAALIEAVRLFLETFLGQHDAEHMNPALSFALINLIKSAGLPLPANVHTHG